MPISTNLKRNRNTPRKCVLLSTDIFRGVSLFLRWIIILGRTKSKGYVESNRLLLKLRFLLFCPRISVFHCKENDGIC